jgi:hypothetical protein
MNKPFVIDKKAFKVEGRTVQVRKQYVKGDEKPHQFQVQAQVKGITAKITQSYPEGAVVNRDSDYSDYDEVKAKTFVVNTLKFLTTKKGAELVSE